MVKTKIKTASVKVNKKTNARVESSLRKQNKEYEKILQERDNIRWEHYKRKYGLSD
jgi:hypothetical protein